MLDPQILEKPGTSSGVTSTSPVLPTIKTMPEKYIGAAAGKPPVVRQIIETKVVAPPPPPKPPAPKPSPKKLHKRRNIIIIAVIIILASLGAAAYILLMPTVPVPRNPPVNINKPVVVNVNINVPPPPPPVSVCGDGNPNEPGKQCDLGTQNGVAGSGCSSTCQTVVVPKPAGVPPAGLDSDSDGLTDIEETTIYGTNPHNPDTMNDGYLDGNQVAHLYDPAQKNHARLKNSSAVELVVNQTEGYSILVPAKWTMSGENTAQFMTTAPTGEFFEVLVTDKPKDQSLVEWYLAMSPGTSESDVMHFTTIQGYDALRSPDRLTTYIDPGNGELYTLTYSYADKTTLEFGTTYEAFIQSFSLNLNGPSKP
jgi:hypothetical protein